MSGREQVQVVLRDVDDGPERRVQDLVRLLGKGVGLTGRLEAGDRALEQQLEAHRVLDGELHEEVSDVAQDGTHAVASRGGSSASSAR